MDSYYELTSRDDLLPEESYSDSIKTESPNSIAQKPNVWRNFQADWRMVGWRKFIAWYSFHLWVWTLVALLSHFRGTSRPWYYTEGQCRPDNQWFFGTKAYNYWQPSNLFEVNLAVGRLSFGAAKLIDVLWDVIVGRGGQAILSYISYKVLTKYITFQMLGSPVSIYTYRTTFLNDGPNSWSTILQAREFFRFRALRSSVGMAWMVTSAVFIISSSTISSAMTAYSPHTRPYVENRAGSWVQAKDYKRVQYIIHDGVRVNRSNDNIVLNSDESYFRGNVSAYVRDCGLYGLNTSSSSFNGIPLPGPCLNISLHMGDGFFLVRNSDGYQGRSLWTGEQPIQNSSALAWSIANTSDLYDQQHMQLHGRCQQAAHYRWGFSFIILFIYLFLLLLWSLGTFLVWLKAHYSLKLNDLQNVAGPYKAILELAQAMQEELTECQVDPKTLNEDQLAKCIQTQLHGGEVPNGIQCMQNEYMLWKSFTSSDGKWWSLPYIMLLGGMIIIIHFIPYLPFTLGGILPNFSLCGSGIVAAALIGRSPGSRILTMVCFMLLSGIVLLPGVMYSLVVGVKYSPPH